MGNSTQRINYIKKNRAPCWRQASNAGGRATSAQTRAPSQASDAQFSFFLAFIICFNRIQNAYSSTCWSIHFYKNHEETIGRYFICINCWFINHPWAPCWCRASNAGWRATSAQTHAPSQASSVWFSLCLSLLFSTLIELRVLPILLYVEVFISSKIVKKQLDR